MRLATLFADVTDAHLVGDPGVGVTEVVYDSRRVVPGSLFCCLPGGAADGHDYAEVAVEHGAVALLCERRLPLDVSQVIVPPGRARPAMASVAAEFHGHPADRLRVVGVTGTNGKTTVTTLIAAALEAGGWPTATIGTLTGARTTPEAPDLQAALASHLAAGKEAVAMEVSSHALAQHRVDAMRFAAAVFTNLSHDHLDFHGTMEAYFQAKASLFRPERAALAVVNVADAWGARLAELCRSWATPLVEYSVADAENPTTTITSNSFTWGGVEVRLGAGGDFNVVNAVAACTTAACLGVAAGDIARGLAAVGPIPGRMEPIVAGQPFDVVVDYAHTPDGLRAVLDCARRSASGHRVLVVFGCGGDRDRAKRPEMGRVAASTADVVIVTDDNPRSEEPQSIIDAILAGTSGQRAQVEVQRDRYSAIVGAVRAARPGDVVVIAGKGHETGQDVAGVVTAFDDREAARRALGDLEASS